MQGTAPVQSECDYAGRVSRKRRPYDAGHRRMEKVLAALYAGGWPAKGWGLFPGANRLRREQREWGVGGGPAPPPLRLAFGSDFHLGPTTHRATLDHAFRL